MVGVEVECCICNGKVVGVCIAPLDEERKAKITALVEKYCDVLAEKGEQLGCIKGMEHTI